MPASFLKGTVAPTAGQGANGDYYENFATGDIYLKSAGAWAIVVNTGDTSIDPAALCTVSDARAWIRRFHASGTTAGDDTQILTILINSVSRAITRYCQREFVPTNAATRTFEYRGQGFLSLAPYDLRNITSVSLAGQALVASTGVGSGDFYPMPRNAGFDGTYLYLVLKRYLQVYPPNSLYAPTLNERDLVIVGDWGMAAVPADVKLACLIAVADMYRNPEQTATRGTGDFAVSEIQDSNPGSDDSLPHGAIRLLEPFVRPTIGSF